MWGMRSEGELVYVRTWWVNLWTTWINQCKNESLTAARMIFRAQALNHAPRRSHRRIHPPLKNSIYTVGVKTISKMSFLRSMGSTKKSGSYGAWEAHFWVLQPLRSETTTFFGALSPQRGVKNDKMWFPRCMRSKTKKVSHGAWDATFLIFVTPLDWYLYF